MSSRLPFRFPYLTVESGLENNSLSGRCPLRGRALGCAHTALFSIELGISITAISASHQAIRIETGCRNNGCGTVLELTSRPP